MFPSSQTRSVRPVFTQCLISGAIGQYYRSELDVESALVFLEHLPKCQWCSALLRDAVCTDLTKQPKSQSLALLMDASVLTPEQRNKAIEFEKVHGQATATSYVVLMHEKNKEA
jgi:hypothetical protein